MCVRLNFNHERPIDPVQLLTSIANPLKFVSAALSNIAASSPTLITAVSYPGVAARVEEILANSISPAKFVRIRLAVENVLNVIMKIKMMVALFNAITSTEILGIRLALAEVAHQQSISFF